MFWLCSSSTSRKVPIHKYNMGRYEYYMEMKMLKLDQSKYQCIIRVAIMQFLRTPSIRLWMKIKYSVLLNYDVNFRQTRNRVNPKNWLKRLGSKTDLNWDKNLIAKIILLGMLKGINAVLGEGSGKGEEEAITAQDDDFVSRRESGWGVLRGQTLPFPAWGSVTDRRDETETSSRYFL